MPKVMPKDSGEMSKTVTKEGSVSLQYPLLTRSNYSAWALKMKIYMRAQGVWDAVECAEPKEDVDMRKDHMALAAIYQGISEDTLLLLAEKETAKEAWEMLKTMHIGAERVKEAKVQTLKCEFEGLRMKEAESVDDFTVRLTIIVNKIRALGEKMEETYVVKKFLRAVPSKFLQIASTIEQFGNLTTMTVEEVVGRLKAHEERLGGFNDAVEEQIFLTRANWKAKEVKVEGEGSFNSSEWRDRIGGRGYYRGRGRGRGRWRNEGDRRNEGNHRERKFDKAKVRCYNCQNYGHFASECQSKEMEEEAHFAEKQDDEEPMLLMNDICEPVQWVQHSAEETMLQKEKVNFYIKVCNICGDAGREECLAICSRCSDGAEHIYCMRKMIENVPEGEWLCEECKAQG